MKNVFLTGIMFSWLALFGFEMGALILPTANPVGSIEQPVVINAEGGYEMPNNLPLDFNFEIELGVYGYSSWDGLFHYLVDAEDFGDYAVKLNLSYTEMDRIWQLLRELNIHNYEREYFIEDHTIPPSGLLLRVAYNGGFYSVRLNDTRLPEGEKSLQKLVDTVTEILDICREQPGADKLGDYPYLIE